MENIINKLKQGIIDAKDEFKKYGYHSSIILDFEETKFLLEVLQKIPDTEQTLQSFRLYCHDEFGESISDYMIKNFIKTIKKENPCGTHCIITNKPNVAEQCKNECLIKRNAK